jgi:hypothetical protein
MDLFDTASAGSGSPEPALQYKAVHVLDEGFHRLFVFRCRGQDESQVAGGLLSMSLDYWGGDIIKAARRVLGRGSARFACNNPIVADWKQDAGEHDYVPDKEQYVLDYLETLWRMLPDETIVESRHFCPEGGAA